jgi:hypothetical protein
MKPQDILILLKLIVIGQRDWIYEELASELFMSKSEIHAGIKRAQAARLINFSAQKTPLRRPLLEFLIHGVKYAYPPKRGSLIRGIPTAYAAPPLSNAIVFGSEPPPVWPYAEGKVRGYKFTPLYRSVPKAALHDQALYELLSLVDAIRDGRVREHHLAVQELTERISQ